MMAHTRNCVKWLFGRCPHSMTTSQESSGSATACPIRYRPRWGRYRVDLSPESPGTRASAKLMTERNVEYQGVTYRCEWHIKLERHRNRIHFALPDGTLSGKILVGLFVDHLKT